MAAAVLVVVELPGRRRQVFDPLPNLAEQLQPPFQLLPVSSDHRTQPSGPVLSLGLLQQCGLGPPNLRGCHELPQAALPVR